MLHVGTGSAQLLVVSVDTCTGPRAYVGLASSYYQFVAENWERVTDEEWLTRIGSVEPVAWLEGVQTQ